VAFCSKPFKDSAVRHRPWGCNSKSSWDAYHAASSCLNRLSSFRATGYVYSCFIITPLMLKYKNILRDGEELWFWIKLMGRILRD